MARIGVTVNLPTTEEGMKKLQEAMIQFNSRVLACALNKCTDIPYDAKVQYLNSLNGCVPWAGEEG